MANEGITGWDLTHRGTKEQLASVGIPPFDELPVPKFDYERALMDSKYILAGLVMMGDMLAECIADPALTAEERQEFLGDQVEVERLIIEYQDSVQEYEEEM